MLFFGCHLSVAGVCPVGEEVPRLLFGLEALPHPLHDRDRGPDGRIELAFASGRIRRARGPAQNRYRLPPSATALVRIAGRTRVTRHEPIAAANARRP